MDDLFVVPQEVLILDVFLFGGGESEVFGVKVDRLAEHAFDLLHLRLFSVPPLTRSLSLRVHLRLEWVHDLWALRYRPTA